MKKIKVLIIVLVLLLGYALIIYLLFNNKKDNDINGNNADTNINSSDTKIDNNYLIINNINYKYINQKFVKVDHSLIKSDELFNVFINNKYYGNYYLKYGGVWNLFDEKNKYTTYDGNILASSKNFNIVVRNIKIREINEQDKIYLINNYNINSFDYLTFNQVIDIDLDNNGEMDEIINLSSKEDTINLINQFNILLIKLNGNYIKLVEERGENAHHVYNIMSIINILNNDYDSIVISSVEGILSDERITNYLIYQYKNNNYSID